MIHLFSEYYLGLHRCRQIIPVFLGSAKESGRLYATRANMPNRLFAREPRNAIISGMTWQHYLRVKTRDPAFLWRMVSGIIAAGVVLGWLAQLWPVP